MTEQSGRKRALPLTVAFAAAAALTVGVLTAGCGHEQVPEKIPEAFLGAPVPMTEGERKMVALFGDELDRDIIRKNFRAEDHSFIAGSVADRRNIVFYGPKFFERDYSRTKNIFNFGAFLHETTHLWQNQNRYKSTRGRCPMMYYYFVSDRMRFADYCDEQQGAIIEDYARRFLFDDSGATAARRIMQNLFTNGRPRSSWVIGWEDKTGLYSGADVPETDERLIRIVEDRFPRARPMRLAVAAGKPVWAQ